jgi:polyhydroxybutyrate depolymerase
MSVVRVLCPFFLLVTVVVSDDVPGFDHHTISWSGTTRNYWVHVPSGTINGMVMFFHGLKVKTEYTCNGDHKYSFQAKPMADAKGFIAVCPQGLGTLTNRGWNVGPCCGHASNSNTDDVGFVNKMLDNLKDVVLPAKGVTYPTQNVFAFGFSTGGAFTYRLACELKNRIDGIAPVGATFNWAFSASGEGKMAWATSCSTDVPVWNSIGDADKFTPACTALTKWRSYAWDELSCNSDAETETDVDDDVTCWQYKPCGTSGSRAAFCLYEDSKHEVKPLMQGADYWHTERAWDFLASGTLPTGASGPTPTASFSDCTYLNAAPTKVSPSFFYKAAVALFTSVALHN